MIAQSKSMGGFASLPRGQRKSDMVWLLQLAAHDDRRVEVVRAILQHKRQREMQQQVVAAAKDCEEMLPEVEWWDEASRPEDSVADIMYEDRVLAMRRAQQMRPYQFTPAVTTPGDPDRHPWDGVLGDISFTEVSAGIGMFAACFRAAGAQCTTMIEPNGESMEIARQNCPAKFYRVQGLEEIDPAELPWTHGIVGGPECQPFSSAGRQKAWADSRSYTLLRTMHIAAVMQPWWVWLENVKAIATVQGGAVWEVITEIARCIGFRVRLKQV